MAVPERTVARSEQQTEVILSVCNLVVRSYLRERLLKGAYDPLKRLNLEKRAGQQRSPVPSTYAIFTLKKWKMKLS